MSRPDVDVSLPNVKECPAKDFSPDTSVKGWSPDAVLAMKRLWKAASMSRWAIGGGTGHPRSGLHAGESAHPRQADVTDLERPHDRGVVGDRLVGHLQPGDRGDAGRQQGVQPVELGRVLVGDGRDDERPTRATPAAAPVAPVAAGEPVELAGEEQAASRARLPVPSRKVRRSSVVIRSLRQVGRAFGRPHGVGVQRWTVTYAYGGTVPADAHEAVGVRRSGTPPGRSVWQRPAPRACRARRRTPPTAAEGRRRCACWGSSPRRDATRRRRR